jgi:L-amino acid N-acyltransferase YncA
MVSIRLATVEDAEQIQAIYAPFCSHSPVTFETQAPTVEEMGQRINKLLQQYPWLVCYNKDKILGYVYAAPHHERAAYQWSVNVSVYIHETARRLGIGRALYTSLFKILELQGYYNAYAGISLPNPASLRLHEAMGFQLAGMYPNVGFKAGAWHDVAWLVLALKEELTNPTPPISINSLRDRAEFESALTSGLILIR